MTDTPISRALNLRQRLWAQRQRDDGGMLHRWTIDAEQYIRHEARRGSRHAFEQLDPATTALIVVDMIPFFIESNPYARGIVANVNALADALRLRGGTVAWVLPATNPPAPARVEFLGPAVADTYRTSAGSGSLEARLWHELAVDGDDDLLVEKSSPGAFIPGHGDLHGRLQARVVETVIVVGTVANVCCESTVREASALGYRTIMVADANAAMNDSDLNATLHTIYRSFGDVRPTDEIIELIATGVRLSTQ